MPAIKANTSPKGLSAGIKYDDINSSIIANATTALYTSIT